MKYEVLKGFDSNCLLREVMEALQKGEKVYVYDRKDCETQMIAFMGFETAMLVIEEAKGLENDGRYEIYKVVLKEECGEYEHI